MSFLTSPQKLRISSAGQPNKPRALKLMVSNPESIRNRQFAGALCNDLKSHCASGLRGRKREGRVLHTNPIAPGSSLFPST